MTYWCVACWMRDTTFSLKTENSKQQKTDVKTNINVQHSYSHGLAIHLDEDKKPEPPQFICRQKRYTSRPDRPSLSRAVATLRSRLKITLSHGDTCELQHYQQRLDQVTTQNELRYTTFRKKRVRISTLQRYSRSP